MKLRKLEKQDNAYLRRKFDELNRLHFEGKVKVDVVRYGGMLLDPILGRTTFGYFSCDVSGKERKIMVNKHLNKYSIAATMPWASELVLHHEMCHAYLLDNEQAVMDQCAGVTDQHGPEFQALMKRHPLHEKSEAVDSACEEILANAQEDVKKYLASRTTISIKKEHLIAANIPSVVYITADDLLVDLLRGKEVSTKALLEHVFPTPEQVEAKLKEMASVAIAASN